MKLLDLLFERSSRKVANVTSRRKALARFGSWLAVGTAAPLLLPIDRVSRAHAAEVTGKPGDPGDPNSCDYWRYCALDGNLCNDCGGTLTSCPPGAEASKVSWVGTCRNPNDGKDYLVSYNDCCGKAMCNGTSCLTSERERPGYRMGLHNDINWCMANTSMGYHCTVAVLVGIADNA